jgi:hypothetical protein
VFFIGKMNIELVEDLFDGPTAVVKGGKFLRGWCFASSQLAPSVSPSSMPVHQQSSFN